MEKSPRRFGFIFYLLIIGALLFLVMGLFDGDEPSQITYSQLSTLFREEQVKSFVIQGSSIELSADGPIREPYAVYFQGGLTWYHAKLGILMSLQKLVEAGEITL